MIDELKKRYSVDGVPLALRAPFYGYGYSLGIGLRAYLDLVHHTSTIEQLGREHLAASSNHIFCYWHEAAFLYPAVFHRVRDHALLQHPPWYMKPIHVFVALSGARLILGSSGHRGHKAAAALVGALREGHSTVILPDGPYGPLHALRKGILHIALQSGVPIVPLRFALTRFRRLGGWDRKIIPLPFGRIRVTYADSIRVEPNRLEEAAARVTMGLG
jgi:lysophospholipid acyltransferase (LPLAT)-like uncharacterized protein